MGLIAKLRSLFGKGRPQAPKLEITGGHRGIAAGSLKERHRRMAAGEQAYTPEEVEKWRNVTKDEAEDFVNGGQPLFVHSSNVSHLLYYPETNQLQISFLNGHAYLYDNISKEEAQGFVTAQSKGGEIWSVLRIRGTRTGHRKPFKKIK